MFLSPIIRKILYPEYKANRYKNGNFSLKGDVIATSKEKRYITIQRITQLLVSSIDFEEMAQKVVDLMVQEMDYIGGIFFIPETSTQVLIPWTTSDSPIVKSILKILPKNIRQYSQPYLDKDSTNLIARTFIENKEFISERYSDFVTPALSKTLAGTIQSTTGIKQTVAYPVRYKGEVLAVIMFNTTRPIIDEEEMQMIKTFSELVGIAMNNSFLFTSIKQNNINLSNKNKELTSLYNLTSQISKSLDPDVVSQTAVDSLPQDQTMIGAILTEYVPADGSITVKALTQNRVSDAARNLLGDFQKYKTLTNDPSAVGTPTVKAILSGEPQFTDDLVSAFSPPIPKTLVTPLLRIINVKSLAVYPVISRGRVVGTIGYLMKDKSYTELEENQKQLLQTYTTQISIALENARLFTEVERVKNNLEIGFK